MKSYIEYRLTGTKPKTNVYTIFSKSLGDRLGEIKWYAPWRQYCFFPDEGTVWSKGCLNEVNVFIKQFMDAWKLGRALEKEIEDENKM